MPALSAVSDKTCETGRTYNHNKVVAVDLFSNPSKAVRRKAGVAVRLSSSSITSRRKDNRNTSRSRQDLSSDDLPYMYPGAGVAFLLVAQALRR